MQPKKPVKAPARNTMTLGDYMPESVFTKLARLEEVQQEEMADGLKRWLESDDVDSDPGSEFDDLSQEDSVIRAMFQTAPPRPHADARRPSRFESDHQRCAWAGLETEHY